MNEFGSLVHKIQVTMFKMADKLKAKGAAAVLFITKEEVSDFLQRNMPIIFDISLRCNQPTKQSKVDEKVFYNLLAAAAGKIMQSLRTLKDSGSGSALTGEFDHRGGIVVEWGDEYFVFVAFSGATEDEDEDVIIARAGEASLPDYTKFMAIIESS